MKYFYLIIFIIIPSFVLSQSTPSIFNDGDITGSIGDKSVQLYGWCGWDGCIWRRLCGSCIDSCSFDVGWIF